MDLTIILFVLRLISSLLLLTLMFGTGWLIYKELKITTEALEKRQQRFGSLRLLPLDIESNENENHQFPVGTTFPLLPLTTIGRSPENMVILPDKATSSRHAIINLRGQQWWLEDLSSRNGTLLNNLPVESGVVISAGDVVTIGHSNLKIEID